MNKLMAPFSSPAQYAHCGLFPYRAIKNTVDIIQQFQQRTVRVVRVVADEKCHQFVHPPIDRMVVGLEYSPLFVLLLIFSQHIDSCILTGVMLVMTLIFIELFCKTLMSRHFQQTVTVSESIRT